jgi:hypothetical protein
VAGISFYSSWMISYHQGGGGTVGGGFGQSSDRAQICTQAGAVHLYLLAEQRLNESRVMSREITHRLPR